MVGKIEEKIRIDSDIAVHKGGGFNRLQEERLKKSLTAVARLYLDHLATSTEYVRT